MKNQGENFTMNENKIKLQMNENLANERKV